MNDPDKAPVDSQKADFHRRLLIGISVVLVATPLILGALRILGVI